MPILHPMHIWNQLGLQVLVPSSIQKSLHFGFHFLLWVHVLQLLWRAKLTRKCQKSLCYEFTSLQLVYKKARFCGSADISSHECWILYSTHFYMSAHMSLHTFPWGAGRIHFGFVYITVSLEYSESLRAKLNTSCYEPATTLSFPIMKLKGSKRLLRILGLWPRTSKDQDKWTLCWNMNEMCHVGVRVRVPGKQTERHV